MPGAYGLDSVSAGGPERWILECSLPKAWTARAPATRTSPEHPGTAVRWDGLLYEVVSLSRSPAGKTLYVLSPWTEAHVIRRIEDYDESSEAARLADRVDQAERARRRRTLLLLAPLAGHVPADVQETWEREYDVSASLLTIVSAAPLFLYGVFCSLFLTIGGFAGQNLFPIPLKWQLLGVYFLVESGFRISMAWSGSQPSGSLAGALAYRTWRALFKPRARSG
jgi:hypothetical protein